MQSSRRLRSFSVVAFLLVACHSAFGQTDAQVKQLIDQLDNPAYATRRQATQQLEGYIKNNQLTADQYGILRTYPANPPYELLLRKEQVLSRWTTTYPNVQNALSKVRFLTEEPKFEGDTNWDYQFDGFYGRAGQLDQAAQKFAATLAKRDAAFRNAIASADAFTILNKLNQLRTHFTMNYPIVNPLLFADPDRLNGLMVDDILPTIDGAIFDATNAINDMDIGANNMQGPARVPKPVNGSGALDVGRTLRLGLALNPVTNGDLDIYMSPYSLGFSPPPAGYRFAGELFSLTPSDSLDVTGNTISVGLVYGEFDLRGSPIADPSELRIARLANGKFDILDPCTTPFCEIAADSFLIRGTYTPDPSSFGLDQFGEFVLVRPVPEPATVGLLLVALLLVAGQRRR